MLELSHDMQLTRDAVIKVARGGAPVSVASRSLSLLDERRTQVVQFIQAQPQPAYGFNRGFGHNVDRPVDPGELSELQRNLIRSHSSGVGEAASREVVRAAMVLRAQSLTKGYSGVRSKVVTAIVAFLNSDIVPFVPLYGSVGASGDLAPLSHIALALMGEGKVFHCGKLGLAADALKAAGIEPLQLEMKEGLALNNGVQFSTAIALLAAHECRSLLMHAVLASALSAEVLLGTSSAYAPDLHTLRPHPGSIKVASWLYNLMDSSPLRRAHRDFTDDGEVQDPYSIRCVPQVLGACDELIADAERTIDIEINSATDNPLILPDANGAFNKIVSGGHFHGMPIAVRVYGLLECCGIIARLSNLRCARYVDEARNKGLGSDLIWPALTSRDRATSSGMMIPEYVSAALTNVIWGELLPNHIFSLSTDAGQEDHVSMSAGLAVKLMQTLPHVARVLAIELAMGAQAAAIRAENEGFPTKIAMPDGLQADVDALEQEIEKKLAAATGSKFSVELRPLMERRLLPSERKLSEASEAVVEHIRKQFPIVTRDRALGAELEDLGDLVRSGELLRLSAVSRVLA